MRGDQLYVAAAWVLLPSLLAGCSVKVHRGENGEDKDVEVHVPMGEVHVRQGLPTAADLGLPAYPGAATVPGTDGDSADVHVGFGSWQMHLRVAKYQTGDPQAKVISFYRKALGQYGQVIACQDGEAVGSPSFTSEGLGCREHLVGANSRGNDDERGLSLRAGSKRHQHIVQLQPSDGQGIRFTLLRLDLPGEAEQADRLE